MSVIPATALQHSDLRLLGHNLFARVREDHHQVHDAVNRSLAVHDEQLSDEDERAIEAAMTSEYLAS